jgi:hypothetical protein
VKMNIATPGNQPFSLQSNANGPNMRSGDHRAAKVHRRMPFIGIPAAPPTSRKLAFAYTLDLDEDLYLRDHLFVRAALLKPIEACMPIMPMVFSMEMMAEAAACLAPGRGLIGFENVRASQWIDLKGGRKRKLIVTATVQADDDCNGSRRVQAAIQCEGDNASSISATVVLGRHYLLSLSTRFDGDDLLRPFPFTADHLYREGFLFHGPLLQCIHRIRAVGQKTIIGEITSSPGKRFFRSIHAPQLLTAPDLIDGMAQLSCAWFVDKSWRALPIGIEKMEIYRPMPQAGACLPVIIQIKKRGNKTLSIDLEIQDGAQRVWMRVKNWRFWIVRFTCSVSNFLRKPDGFPISRHVNMPGLPADAVAQAIEEQDLQDVNMDWLARTCLHLNEWPAYLSLAGRHAHQRRWLLARIVAKDAVRLWCSRRHATASLLHPAAMQLSEKDENALSVRSLPGITEVPWVHVARANNSWVAVANQKQLDIDLNALASADNGTRKYEKEAAACR